MTKIKNNNHYTIQGWMLNELNLKGTALSVYAIIYGFTQDGETEFNGSRQYLADFTGTSKPTIDKALDELCHNNYISKQTILINNVIFNKYKVNLQIIENFTSSKETLQGSKETLLGGSKETLHNNISNYINNNIDYKYIVGYLNQKANTNYKASTNNTQKHINARIKDGFTMDDFIKVIDNKVKEWKGTTFEKYLRPDTLFGTKFESYLNGKQINPNASKKFTEREYSKEELNSLYTDIHNINI